MLGVVKRGYPLMRAHFPRCYVDVNREPYELDPRMFEGRLPSFANTRSMRVAGGLGTVARVVGDAQEIYDRRISVNDALRRIESLYKPYHRALRRLFTQGASRFRRGDADRLPFHAVDHRRRQGRAAARRRGARRPLRHELRRRRCRRSIESTLRSFGYAVSRNKPYAGGFITEHYGNPAAGLHTIQLEINRGLYMDERRFERSADFPRLAAHLEMLADRVAGDPDRGAAALSRRRRIGARDSNAQEERGRRQCRAAQV